MSIAFKMHCKGCGKQIRMMRNSKTKNWLPVDEELIVTKGGETIITKHGDVIVKAVAGIEGYISHFATCEKADEFRRKRDGSLAAE